ncbi:sulfite exporter TauE/SafE family protein [uncultured Desulfuromonas sp.]|mgnify:CR=1 FL=1|uniref:sulfite exporter TauE/SafE family protein n=1 Tax=uncultured Desulfuromonas sp. TaxID=181013 RepID=UPI002627139F|nr:sulfite exporter TauE/SafE family protein [uncultured Desulfuromonas sp.]
MDAWIWQVPVLVVAGAAAGFLNVLAGGGSLLTLPLLIFLGLPAAVANGTNRVAIFFQNIFAIAGFRRQGVFPARLALLCTLPALAGSYLGASLAVDIDEELFRRLLALIMIGVLLFTLLDPARRWRVEVERFSRLRLTILLASFFLIGVYGGFVQAGVGFLVISGLLAHGLDLVRINAVKVIVIFGFTVVALGVFVAHGQVDYGLGTALAAGNSAGGWIASHVAVKKGHRWIRGVVSLTVLVFALKLFFG